MARRIAKHLDSGIKPTISERRVVLQDVVIVRASGQEAPAAEEARRQAAARGTPMDISFGTALQRSSAKGKAYPDLTFLAFAT